MSDVTQSQQASQPAQDDPIRAILADKVAETKSLREQLDALTRAQAEREAQAEQQRLSLLAAKEGAEKALEEQRVLLERRAAELEAKSAQTQERWMQAELSRVVATAIASQQWLEGGAETATKLLRDELEAKMGPAGDVQVVHRATGLSAAQYIAEAIARPPFTHLIAASGQGGSGATSPPPPGPVHGGLSSPAESALRDAWLARIGTTPGIPGFGRSPR